MTQQDTSLEAYYSILPHNTELNRQVVDIFHNNPGGLTATQVEHLSGRTHQSVSGNISRLKNDGVLIDSGRRGITSSNRQCIIWELAEDYVRP